MRSDQLLAMLSHELPILIRQLRSSDDLLQAAAHLRLQEFAAHLHPWRSSAHHRPTRRYRHPTTFTARSLRPDD